MKPRVLLIAALALSPVFASEPLKCPSGAQARREPELRNGRRTEWCEDTATRKQNGPARVSNAAGDTLVEIELRQGEVTSQRFTRLGLELMLGEVNAAFAKEGKQAAFKVIDEHTLRFDMTFKGATPGGDVELFRKQVLAAGPVCRMLAPAATDFRTVNIYASNEKKEALGSTTITRADCEKR